MKKFFLAAMSVLCLASLIAVPVGCSSNEATQIEGGEQEQPPEHQGFDESEANKPS